MIDQHLFQIGIICINMIVSAIAIASLLSGALGSYDSLAKCLYEEEVADAQVGASLFGSFLLRAKLALFIITQDTLWNNANCNEDGTGAVEVCLHDLNLTVINVEDKYSES